MGVFTGCLLTEGDLSLLFGATGIDLFVEDVQPKRLDDEPQSRAEVSLIDYDAAR